MAKNNREGKALVLDYEQRDAIFAELQYPHNAIASLCYWSASRAGEIVALPTRAIGYRSISIKQSKVEDNRHQVVVA